MPKSALLLLVVPLALLAAGCGGSSSSKGNAAPASTGSTVAPNGCGAQSPVLKHPGQLTIGTDNPAYPPWYGGGSPKGSPWKINDPSTGKGFESAVAYAVAKQLGFQHGAVKWIYTPFNKAFAPGPKAFDFDINQVSYTPARAKVVDFSSSYYDVNQAVVVLNGRPIASARSTADLAKYKLGAQLGTTSYQYIVGTIKPKTKPAVFDTNDAAVQALKNKQIDGLVVDLPTAFYVTAAQVPGSKILGQFPTTGGGEHFGMVFKKGNALAGCVDDALGKLRGNGTLKQLQQQWLAKATGAPILK
jgi:polar amino acid transport system substrate-binding protein